MTGQKQSVHQVANLRIKERFIQSLSWRPSTVLTAFETGNSMAYCVVIMTASSSLEADKITQVLLENKLAACVNQIPGLKSSYWWEGQIKTETEILLLAKTNKVKVKELIK